MRKKTKVYVLIGVVFILVLICRSVLTFDSINYKLNIGGNKIKIKELVNKDNYYIEIKTDKNTYPIRIYDNLNNKRKVIKNIYYYKDKNIECVLPVINNKLYTDMQCIKEGILYNYNDLQVENASLDKYVSSIEKYNIKKFNNEPKDTKNIDTVKYNIHDVIKHTSAITTYKGLIINDKQIKIFEKDIYNNKLSTFLNNYYIIADYEKTYSYNNFYIVNLDTKKVTTLESKNKISYDSYIQGIVDNKIYLYDRNNENQYEIDVEKSKIKVISSDNYVKYYTNKKWGKLNKTKANKEIYFDYGTLDNNFSTYDYVEETDNYYYLYKKDGISYKLYRVDKNNIEVYKYILNVPTTNIYFENDYLYYVYKTKLYYYSDEVGLKTILENSELEFNDTIKYHIY